MNLEKDIAEGLDVRTRLILWLAALVAVIVAGIVLVAWAEHRGAAIERATWAKKEARRQADTVALLRKHAEDVAALTLQYNLNNLKVSDDHDKELETLRRDRAADRAAADRAGGLRIPRAVCDPAAAGPEAASAGGRDDASASTVRLPQQVESDLWDLADQADEVSAQLRSCQAWIVTNGFYGLKPTESKQLLDRMVSSQNQDSEAPHADD